jgi:hypothetical protein
MCFKQKCIGPNQRKYIFERGSEKNNRKINYIYIKISN